MKKNVFGRQFKRTKNQRTALFKGLISSLILHGKIQTTLEKAKSIKGDVDKIITKAKKGEIEGKRLLLPILPKEAISKVLNIARGFSKRHGGYTRIVKLGKRFSDSASMISMEWVEGEEVNPSASSGEKLKVKSEVKELIAGKIEKKASIKKETAKSKTKRKVAKK